MSAVLDYNSKRSQSLPPCEGPKLHRFKHHSARVDFVKLLSPLDAEDETTGGHGHVFEVRIKSTAFALKVFKFFQPSQSRELISSNWSSQVSDDILAYHDDPFFAECRAYGRIIEHEQIVTNKNKGKSKGPDAWESESIVVPCFGYLLLPAEKYEDTLFKFGIKDWNRQEEDENASQKRKPPFRALVKELVDSADSILNPPTMLKDLKRLRSIGVYQRDIFARNYKRGKLVDFSIAWTTPHWLMSLMKEEQLVLWMNEDLYLFDEMIEADGIKTRVRASRNRGYCKKLRKRKSSTLPVSSRNNI